MMNLKPILPVSLIFMLLCNQAFSQHISKAALPADFNCSGCILVIFKEEPKNNLYKFNEMVEKKLIGNYDGKSIFVTAADADTNSLYADKNIYRFVLDCDFFDVSGVMATPKTSGGQKIMNYHSTALNFHLYDRLTKKGYPQISNYGSWPKTMDKVVGALNKLLKK